MKKIIKKLQRKTFNLIKNIMVILLIMMIILSNIASISFAFDYTQFGGQKGDPGRMPAEWVQKVEEFAKGLDGYSQPERNTPGHADCSSFVCRMTQLLLGKPEKEWPMTTGTIASDERFEKIEPSQVENWDVLSTDVGGKAHMVFYAGGGYLMGSGGVSAENPNGFGYHTGYPADFFDEAYRIKGEFGGNYSSDSNSSYNSKTVLEELPSNTVVNKGKFYYIGIPKGKAQAGKKVLEQIVTLLSKIAEFLINTILLLLRLPFIGYITLFETSLTNMLEATLGINEYSNHENDSGYYIDSKRSLNVENIVFDRVEAFKIDFFVSPQEAINRIQGKTGTGADIENINKVSDQEGNSAIARKYESQNKLTEELYNKTPLGRLRASFALTYYTVFMVAIGVTFIAGLVAAIMSIVTVLGAKKARYKELTVVWLKGIVLTLLTTTIIIAVIKFNGFIVNTIYDVLSKSAPQTVSIYQNVRERAYAFNPMVGFLGLAMYSMMVWYTLRFTVTYLRRLVYILFLSLLGTIIPIYGTFQTIIKGKSDVYTKWYKEFFINVLVQSLHALTFTVFATVMLKISDSMNNPFLGIIFILIIYKYMLEFTKIIISMFGLERGSKGYLSKLVENGSPVAIMNELVNSKLGKKVLNNELLSDSGKQGLINAKNNAIMYGYNAAQRLKDTHALYKQSVEGDKKFSIGAYSPNTETEIPLTNKEEDPILNSGNPKLDDNLVLNFDQKLRKMMEQESENLPLEEKVGLKDRLKESFTKEKLLGPKWSNLEEYGGVVIDENGRKRMLKGDMYYDSATNTLKRGKSSIDKLNENFDKKASKETKKAIAEAKKQKEAIFGLMKSSLGLSIKGIVGIALWPSVITEGIGPSLGIYNNLFRSKVSDFKKNANVLREYSDKAGVKVPFDDVRNAGRDLKAGFFNKMSNSNLLTEKARRKMKRRRDALNKLNGSKYRFNGITFNSLNTAINQANSELLEKMAQAGKISELGKVKIKGVDYKNKRRVYKSLSHSELNKKRKQNEELKELANFSLDMQQEYVRDAIKTELGRTYYELERGDNNFIDNTQMIGVKDLKNRSRYLAHEKGVLQAKELRALYGNYANINKDDLDANVIALNSKESFNNGVANNVIKKLNKYTINDILDMDNRKFERVLDSIIKENNLVELTNEEKSEIKTEMLSELYELNRKETNFRTWEKAEKTTYVALNKKGKEARRINELRDMEVKDLTIEQMKDLQADRIQALFEADRAIENIKKINDFNASAFTKGNQKIVEKYVTKGKIGKLENVTGDIKKMMEENAKVNKRNQSFKDQLNQGRKKTRD